MPESDLVQTRYRDSGRHNELSGSSVTWLTQRLSDIYSWKDLWGQSERQVHVVMGEGGQNRLLGSEEYSDRGCLLIEGSGGVRMRIGLTFMG